MERADLVVSSARVVTPQGVVPAAVAITAGVITSITRLGDAPDAVRRVDVGAAALLPGGVDTHVHVNEPGRTDWEGFESATRAAAAGGITTIVDMPLNSIPVTTTVDALEQKAHAAAGRAAVDYAFWGGVIPGNREALAPLANAGARGFKAFLVPSGIDEFPAVGEADLRSAMLRIAPLGLPLLVHAELPGPIARAAPSSASDPRRYPTYLSSRPAAAELEAVDLVLGLCRETGCRVHIVHVSAAETLERLREARRSGLSVSAETCPHYLTFAAEEIMDGGTPWKCAPPIRGRVTRERLWRGLGDGALDLVASDHSPAPPALKCLETGDFFRAWGGVASLELALAATWTGARARGHGLGEMVRWLAEAPARLAGFGRKGRIAPGCDADLVVFDADASFTVEPTRLRQRHPITPYAGMTLTGVVRQTFLRGVSVYEEGAFPSEPTGRWVRWVS
ncbi:MAG TPA: allantoinase AllB [Gemmatimonadales bacterium]|nr:allantoinase AllB [Gemmatimonadales bacterium]